MAYLWSGVLMLILGSVISSCFWLSYLKARDEGYNRGYEQAMYECGLKNEKHDDQVIEKNELFGFPSTGAKITQLYATEGTEPLQ